jgi:hypothetical protein
MLAQKDTDVKNLKSELETQIKEVTSKLTTAINLKEIENQSQQEKIEQLSKIVESHEELKAVMNVTLVTEQNKILKT